MKKTRLASGLLMALILTNPVTAEERAVQIGVLLGFSGAAESLAPDIAGRAELAVAEATDSAKSLGRVSVDAVSANSTCNDTETAKVAAAHLSDAEAIDGLVGGLCSGATMAILNKGPYNHWARQAVFWRSLQRLIPKIEKSSQRNLVGLLLNRNISEKQLGHRPTD